MFALFYCRLDSECAGATNIAPYSPNNIKNFEETNPFRTNISHNGSFGKASIHSGLRFVFVGVGRFVVH